MSCRQSKEKLADTEVKEGGGGMAVFLNLACETQVCYENTGKERGRKRKKERKQTGKGEMNIFSSYENRLSSGRTTLEVLLGWRRGPIFSSDSANCVQCKLLSAVTAPYL